jgi:hypothetical protein
VAPSSAEVGAGEAGPSNRLAESVPDEPQHDETSMDAEEATATLIEESAGSSASTQEQALLVNAFDQPALLYAAPTVPRKAWEPFTSHASEVLRRVVSTAANGGQEHCAARRFFRGSGSVHEFRGSGSVQVMMQLYGSCALRTRCATSNLGHCNIKCPVLSHRSGVVGC